MALRLHVANGRTHPQGHLAWAPTLTAHDPNPPLPLEDPPPIVAADVPGTVLELWLGAGIADPYQQDPSAAWAWPLPEDTTIPPLPDAVGSMTPRGLQMRESQLRRIYPPREWFVRTMGPRWRW